MEIFSFWLFSVRFAGCFCPFSFVFCPFSFRSRAPSPRGAVRVSLYLECHAVHRFAFHLPEFTGGHGLTGALLTFRVVLVPLKVYHFAVCFACTGKVFLLPRLSECFAPSPSTLLHRVQGRRILLGDLLGSLCLLHPLQAPPGPHTTVPAKVQCGGFTSEISQIYAKEFRQGLPVQCIPLDSASVMSKPLRNLHGTLSRFVSCSVVGPPNSALVAELFRRIASLKSAVVSRHFFRTHTTSPLRPCRGTPPAAVRRCPGLPRAWLPQTFTILHQVPTEWSHNTTEEPRWVRARS